MKRTIFMLACLLGLGGVSSHAMMVDMPLPVMVAKSQRVVIARVTQVGTAAEMEVQAPWAKAPAKGWWRRYTVTVREDLKHAAAPATTTTEALTILAEAPAPPPPVVEGQPMMMVSDGPAYPILQQDQDYMLMLEKMPRNPELYLPAYFKNFRRVDDPMVAEVRKVANPDKWSWGKTVDGLQLAFMPRVLYVHRNAQNAPVCFLQAVAAVRNQADHALQVNLYAGDKTLNVNAVKDQVKVSPDWYANPNHQREYDPKADCLRLQPGEIAFIGPQGPAGYGLGFDLPLTPGTWSISAGYTNQRALIPTETLETDAARLRTLWTGTLESAAVTLEVPAPPAGN